MTLRRIALGVDHAGFSVKQALVKMLSAEGYAVVDCGTSSDQSVDYPDYARRVAKAVQSKRCERGILVCGTGIGMSIAANKHKGIRAAVCWSSAVARLAAQHNWANVLCLPSRFASARRCQNIARAWLKTDFDKGGRHERRVGKINRFDAK